MRRGLPNNNVLTNGTPNSTHPIDVMYATVQLCSIILRHQPKRFPFVKCSDKNDLSDVGVFDVIKILNYKRNTFRLLERARLLWGISTDTLSNCCWGVLILVAVSFISSSRTSNARHQMLGISPSLSASTESA